MSNKINENKLNKNKNDGKIMKKINKISKNDKMKLKLIRFKNVK